MPVVPEVANRMSLHDGSGILPITDAWENSGCFTFGLSVLRSSDDIFVLRCCFSFLGKRLANFGTGVMIIPFILSPLISLPQLCIMPKHATVTSGSWLSELAKLMKSAGKSSAITKEVGAVLEVLLAFWDAAPCVLCGHSFFQCPFCMQILQNELAILLARELEPVNGPLPFDFPLPFLPKPLSNLRCTGQKPRTFTRSLRRLRASW